MNHHKLSLRKPQTVSIQRVIRFNADKVNRFHDLLEDTVYTTDGARKIPKSNIYG